MTPQFGATFRTMATILHTVPSRERVPPGELPASPDDIDLDRVVTDPAYRRAVLELLRRWGICDDRDRRKT